MSDYQLWLDDDAKTIGMESFRYPPNNIGETWIIASSIEEAKQIVKENGMPIHMDLDHDLGTGNAMEFLKWLAFEYWDGKSQIPTHDIHSMNPIGRANIAAFMYSWARSIGKFPPLSIH